MFLFVYYQLKISLCCYLRMRILSTDAAGPLPLVHQNGRKYQLYWAVLGFVAFHGHRSFSFTLGGRG